MQPDKGRVLMRIQFFLLMCVAAAALAAPGDIISQIPAPGGNPDGLTWVDGYLWITSDTDYMLYKVDPADGAVVDQITPPGSGSGSLTGLTWDGEHLLCTLQAPPWRIYFIDTETGLAVDSIPTPSASNNEGLAWDGTYIWSTNYSNNVIYKLDPGTGDVLEYFQPYSPMGCTGLAFDGFNIYVSMQNTPMIYVLLPMVPQPVSYFMLSCETPQDIAWDGTYIWITEYEETGAQIYQLDPGTQHLSPATWAKVKTVFTE